MEEDPKDHDFDQRHDGPFDQRPSLATRRESSKEGRAPDDTTRSPTSPNVEFSTPISPSEGRKSAQIDRIKGRRSMQHPDRPEDSHSPSGGLHGTSTQSERAPGAPRPSRDFDTRRDGPFGRPSLNMTRRRSSGQPFPHGSSPEARRPTDPTMEKQDEHPGENGTTEPSIETLQSSTDPAFQPEPPPLHYDLWSRKWSIIFFWTLILVDCIAMPIVLYFCLWYLTDFSPNTVFSIVTAALGGISIIEYFVRLRRLWMKSSTCRPIGAGRYYFDWFHWNFTLGWLIIMIELCV